MIMPEQVYSLKFLLALLPIIGGTIYGMDQQQDDPDMEFTGKGGLFDVIPFNAAPVWPGPLPVRFDVANPFWIYEKEERNRRNLMLKRERPIWVTCYEDFRILVTSECSFLQSTDFSDLRIGDFCIGNRIRLGGSINFRVGMSMPSVVAVNVSRAPDDMESFRTNENGVTGLTGTGNAFYNYYFDGCDIIDKIMCLYDSPNWCGCPLSEGVVFLNGVELSAEKDLLPLKMGFGKFIAHITISSPQDIVCVNLAFTRKRIKKKTIY